MGPRTTNRDPRTFALVFDRDFTAEQFRAVQELLWTLYPFGPPEGYSITTSDGLTVTVRVPGGA